jgi:nitrogen fixation protein NifB
VARFGASFHNLIPLYPVAGTAFGVLKEPDAEALRLARAHCGLHLPQMAHCQRCRADAAGLLGQDHLDVPALLDAAKTPVLRAEEAPSCAPSKCATGCSVASTCASRKATPEVAAAPPPRGRRAAVGTLEGALVNLHLGQAPFFSVYEEAPEGTWRAVEFRQAPPAGGGDDRWLALADLLFDCGAVFVSGAGARPLQLLEAAGKRVFTVEGLIDTLLGAWGRGDSLEVYLHSEAHACGEGCRGTGGGCG